LIAAALCSPAAFVHTACAEDAEPDMAVQMWQQCLCPPNDFHRFLHMVCGGASTGMGLALTEAPLSWSEKTEMIEILGKLLPADAKQLDEPSFPRPSQYDDAIRELQKVRESIDAKDKTTYGDRVALRVETVIVSWLEVIKANEVSLEQSIADEIEQATEAHRAGKDEDAGRILLNACRYGRMYSEIQTEFYEVRQDFLRKNWRTDLKDDLEREMEAGRAATDPRDKLLHFTNAMLRVSPLPAEWEFLPDLRGMLVTLAAEETRDAPKDPFGRTDDSPKNCADIIRWLSIAPASQETHLMSVELSGLFMAQIGVEQQRVWSRACRDVSAAEITAEDTIWETLESGPQANWLQALVATAEWGSVLNDIHSSFSERDRDSVARFERMVKRISKHLSEEDRKTSESMVKALSDTDEDQ
jgi:hypothetical protein